MTGQPTEQSFEGNGRRAGVAATRVLQDALDDCLIDVADWEFADPEDATVEEPAPVAWSELNQPAEPGRGSPRGGRHRGVEAMGVLRWKLARSHRQPFVFLRGVGFVAAVSGIALGLEYILFLRL